MTRLQLIFPLLLICLVLVALGQHYASTSSLQDTKSVSFQMSAAVYNSRKTGVDIQNVWRNTKEATEKKDRKTPSGPSPVGNTRPPSRP